MKKLLSALNLSELFKPAASETIPSSSSSFPANAFNMQIAAGEMLQRPLFFSEEQAKEGFIFYPGGIASTDSTAVTFISSAHPKVEIRLNPSERRMGVSINGETFLRQFKDEEDLLSAARQLAGETHAWATSSAAYKTSKARPESKAVLHASIAAVSIVALVVLLQFASHGRDASAPVAASNSSSGLVAAPSPAIDAATLAAFQAAAMQAQNAAVSQGSASSASALSAGAPAVPAAPREAAKLTAEESKMVDALKGIVIRPGKQMLTVFSDPLCPACREFEKQLAEMDKDVGVRIIPVAFQPGSAEKVATILCAADPAKAWQQAMSVAPIDGAQCEAGKKSASENNAAFSLIQATATPTLVAPNGTLAVGGAEDVRQLNAFVTAFSK